MGRTRSDVDEQVAQLLHTARTSLGLSFAFLSRMDGVTQTLEVVDAAAPLLVRDGVTRPQATSLCQAILDGRLPPVMPDMTREPVAMALPAARMPRLRSYVSVPVQLSSGEVYGTFCAAGLRPSPKLGRRDRRLMDVLARATGLLIEPSVREREREHGIRTRLGALLDEDGPTVLLQPIVRLADGVRSGAEALSRFPASWGRPPDVCFDEAHSIGEGVALELRALHRAAAHFADVDGYVALNVSPATALHPDCTELLASLPLERVLLELSEHDRVDDYEQLTQALAPLRARGLRLAIDDVGAGFSSLRHVVVTSPDVVKLDRTIVTGLAENPVLSKLVEAMATFVHGLGARVVAEGVETESDALALRALGVDDGQGWWFGRPGPASALAARAFDRDVLPS